MNQLDLLMFSAEQEKLPALTANEVLDKNGTLSIMRSYPVSY
ncbi:hypothetical protein [Photorhabdus laumondii]|nr:hypothetical protein [Photorhabdus laumondii]